MVVTCPPIHLCHSHAISRLVGSESRMRKVEAVNSRSYFLINSFTDLRTVMKYKSCYYEDQTYLLGPRPFDMLGLQESVGPPSLA